MHAGKTRWKQSLHAIRWAGATPRIILGTEPCPKVGSLQPNMVPRRGQIDLRAMPKLFSFGHLLEQQGDRGVTDTVICVIRAPVTLRRCVRTPKTPCEAQICGPSKTPRVLASERRMKIECRQHDDLAHPQRGREVRNISAARIRATERGHRRRAERRQRKTGAGIHTEKW